MAKKTPTEAEADVERDFSFKDFLENVPPGRKVRLLGAFRIESSGGRRTLIGSLPQLSLYCGFKSCERIQNFNYTETSVGAIKEKPGEFVARIIEQDLFAGYYCRNCSRTWKTFAIRIYSEADPDLGKIFGLKLGETPPFGPPLPAKLLQLAGEHGDLLKKGRQSENQSLGIGAFAYYRRVVELQKARLIDELKKAIERLGGNNQKALATLEDARNENQFTKALELMADVTPRELFVSGHNPLKLLHVPLSVGLHGLTDEECLENAHSIRIVLAALLERILMITEEKTELDAAIKNLLPPPDNNSTKVK